MRKAKEAQMVKNPQQLSRREFLRLLTLVGGAASLASCRSKDVLLPTQTPVATSAPTDKPTAHTEAIATEEPTSQTTETATATPRPKGQVLPHPDGLPYMSVVKGKDSASITEAAINAIGGIERFVKPGYDVIIKPNICVRYWSYEYAATTNPFVIGALVKMSLDAGAERVRVMDTPFTGGIAEAYKVSGIEDAVLAAGGEMEVMNTNKYIEADIPQGQAINSVKIYKDIIDADLVINVPIPKHHHTAGLTLGCKNLMGVVQNPGSFHSGNLHQCIADLFSLVRPALTVGDAIRVLMANGPNGGNLEDVKKVNTIIASHDCVTVDAYATRFFYRKPETIGFIRTAGAMGLGTYDLDAVQIEELTV
jgi:uncharacterized protein (DUF362 family)